MDKQQDTGKTSSAKRVRSPEKERSRTDPATTAQRSSSPIQPAAQSSEPRRKQPTVRITDPPVTNPSATISEQTPTTVQTLPPVQATRSATSGQSLFTTDSLVLNYFQNLPPDFNLGDAIKKIKAELGAFNFQSTMTPTQAGEDDGASAPAGEDEERETLSGDTEVIGEEEREGQRTRLVDTQEQDDQVDQPMSEAGPEIEEQDQLDQTGETGFEPVDQVEGGKVGLATKDADQPTTMAGPAEAQPATHPGPRELPEQETRGTSPLDRATKSSVQQEGMVEEAQTSSDADTLAANTPEQYRVPETPSPGKEFGTDDVPLAEEGVHFDFAPQEGVPAKETPPVKEVVETEVPRGQGEPFAEKSPQVQEGVPTEKIPPTGGEEGTGETPTVEPVIVNLDSEDSDPQPKQPTAQDNVESGAENEATVPPPSSRRNL